MNLAGRSKPENEELKVRVTYFHVLARKQTSGPEQAHHQISIMTGKIEVQIHRVIKGF
jgi:hypothetical protein